MNEYEDPNVDPPAQPDLNRVIRRIVAENPRIMRFEIEWSKHEGNSNFNP